MRSHTGKKEKPWPFEKVSPLIKGAPGSVVSIAFLRPASSEQEDVERKIPEGQLFRVKIRRQDKRLSSSDMSPRAQHLPDGGSAGPHAEWGIEPVVVGEKAGRIPSPPPSARVGDDDSDVGRADLSIEARLRAHARGAVNAAAMARKLMATSGTLKSGGAGQGRPASAQVPQKHVEVGRNAYSEGYTQVGAQVWVRC